MNFEGDPLWQVEPSRCPLVMLLKAWKDITRSGLRILVWGTKPEHLDGHKGPDPHSFLGIPPGYFCCKQNNCQKQPSGSRHSWPGSTPATELILIAELAEKYKTSYFRFQTENRQNPVDIFPDSLDLDSLWSEIDQPQDDFRVQRLQLENNTMPFLLRIFLPFPATSLSVSANRFQCGVSSWSFPETIQEPVCRTTCCPEAVRIATWEGICENHAVSHILDCLLPLFAFAFMFWCGAGKKRRLARHCSHLNSQLLWWNSSRTALQAAGLFFVDRLTQCQVGWTLKGLVFAQNGLILCKCAIDSHQVIQNTGTTICSGSTKCTALGKIANFNWKLLSLSYIGERSKKQRKLRTATPG